MKLIIIILSLSLIGLGVKGAETWTSEPWGGSVHIQGENWYSQSFGANLLVTGWGNWSEYWVVGQTIVYDCNLNLTVDMDDISDVVVNLTLTGANGWILEDINNDGVINYLDISGVCFYYPWSGLE